MRWLGSLCLGLCAAVSGSWAGEDEPLAQALALEKTMQKVIARCEGAIACILVSRNEAYEKVYQAPPPDDTGKLGGFDPLVIREFDRIKYDQLRRKLDLADPNHVPEAFGSGVAIDAKGLVLTNFHVVQGARKVFVRFPGGKGSYADIHAGCARCDLAVLRLLDQRLAPLPVLPVGDADKLQRGQFLLSLANPFAAGFRDGQPSASWGILSNIRRRAVPGPLGEVERTKPLHMHGTLLQTDARLHLGCSGGALVNLRGELVGLTTAQAAIHGGETPGGFAVPFDAGFRRLLDVLRRGEEIDYGFLGVTFDADQASGHAVALKYVVPESPAARSNLQIRDAIKAVNGQPVGSSDDLFLALGTQLAGCKVTLDVIRAGQGPSRVEVTLAKLPTTTARIASSPGRRPFFQGLRVDYTSLLANQVHRHSRLPAGVLVSAIQPDTPASAAQLKPGEIITHVNGRVVLTPADFYLAVKGLAGPVELTLLNFNGPPAKVVLK